MHAILDRKHAVSGMATVTVVDGRRRRVDVITVPRPRDHNAGIHDAVVQELLLARGWRCPPRAVTVTPEACDVAPTRRCPECADPAVASLADATELDCVTCDWFGRADQATAG